MISQKTQGYLCELLFEIAKGEKQVEVVRQLLGEQDTFEPYSAFRRIDQQRKKFINSYDIKDFLSENGFPHSLQECDLFIKAYDIDQDTKISYTEFLRAVLPYDNQSLREQVSQRPPLELKINEKLSCDVEYTLSKLIDREIQCNIAIIDKKALLETRYDFSVADCFNTLDVNGKKMLDGRDFYAFFRKNGLVSYEDEIISLHRRLDFDQDGYISYEDFFYGISKQETLEKAERRNPHEHQIIASPFRKASKSPIAERKISQQFTPNSSIKKKANQLSSSKKNVQILSPSRAKIYQNYNSEFQNSPIRENSRFRTSTGFKHSPAKSILKNSTNKMDIEKNLLRNELQYSKELDQIQSQYASRNSDYKDDPSYIMRNKIRESSKDVRSDPSYVQAREMFEKERIIEEEKQKILVQEKLKTIDQEEKLRRAREQEEYEYQIQKMKAVEREQQMRQIEKENQLKQQQILRERELQKLKFENDLKQREQERQQKQAENERKYIIEQADFYNKEYEEKQRKIIQLEKEQRLQELERERKINQLEKLKQQQEKEDREKRLIEEEKAIQEQIEYERYLKQKMQDEKRYASIEQNIEKNRVNRPSSYIKSIDKSMDTYNQQQRPQATNYSQKKTASFAERSPVQNLQYSTPKRYDDYDERNTLQSSQLHQNYRNSTQVNNKALNDRELQHKTLQKSPYQKLSYSQTNKYDKPSFTSPIDLRETSKNTRSPISSHLSATKDRDVDRSDLYKKQNFSTSQKQNLTSSINKRNNYNSQIEDQLITYFLDIIQTEKKSERSRQDLALRPDFKLGDIYKILDKTQKGFISSLNLEDFLKKINIQTSINDIYLLMRRYDLDNDGQLRFTDIAEAITPKQSEYAKLLNKRESYLEGDIQIDEVYSYETMKLLKELFLILIESEQIVEQIRYALKQHRSFSFQECFGMIDQDQDGFINQAELQHFFEKNNVFCSDKELKMLIQRFDLDRDNKISFGEFVQELSPKSNKIY
ncbi:hypothetical protein ABPG74_021484 [Tetrahymena malaccensis]